MNELNAEDYQNPYETGLKLFEEKKYSKAFSLFKKAKPGDNPVVLNMLGNCYENGIGTNINYKLACKYYELSADQNFAPAQFKIGLFYARGDHGYLQFPYIAFTYFHKAAVQGYSEAWIEMGDLFIENPSLKFVPEDVRKALNINKGPEYNRNCAIFCIEKALETAPENSPLKSDAQALLVKLRKRPPQDNKLTGERPQKKRRPSVVPLTTLFQPIPQHLDQMHPPETPPRPNGPNPNNFLRR